MPEDVEGYDAIALATLQTNAISAADGIGIFPTTARLNHGCSAAFNAVYSWRDREQVLVVHALKSIRRGEVRTGIINGNTFEFTCLDAGNSNDLH